MKPMYKYQEQGVELIKYRGAMYLMLDMGLGKTRICIEANRSIPYPMFVLAPKLACLDTWPKEIRKWSPSTSFTVLHGPNKEQLWAESDKYTSIIMNYDGLKWFYEVVQKKLRPLQKYFMVFDEASLTKSPTAKRFDILHDMAPIMSRYRVALSGTPAPNTLEDLWAQYYHLDGGQALTPEYYQFRSRYFNYTGADGSPPFQTTLKPGAEKHIFNAIKPITLRMDANDYLELPEVVHNDIKVTLPPSIRELYWKLEDDFMLEFPTSAAICVSSASLENKLRQFLQGAVYVEDSTTKRSGRRRLPEFIHEVKAKVLKELLASSAGQPILAPYQFNFEPIIYNKVLGRTIPVINGNTTAREAKALINKWNAGQLPLLLVHPRSVAYGLNLQTGGHTILWLALPWELDLYQQLIARLARQGQMSNRVVVHRIIFKDTKDEKVASYLKRKDATQQGLFDAILRR